MCEDGFTTEIAGVGGLSAFRTETNGMPTENVSDVA